MVKLSDRLDSTFAALADPTRRTILSLLARGERTVGELAAEFEMTLPGVYKHVRVLERAGLAQTRREGRVRLCAIRAEPMREAAGWIERYRAFWEGSFDKLARYLEEHTREEVS